VRWCRDGDFWRLFCVLYLQRAACSAFQTCILNSHWCHTMCQSMVNIQSPTAEISRGKKKKEERTNHSMKIYMVSLFHRATIIKQRSVINKIDPRIAKQLVYTNNEMHWVCREAADRWRTQGRPGPGERWRHFPVPSHWSPSTDHHMEKGRRTNATRKVSTERFCIPNNSLILTLAT